MKIKAKVVEMEIWCILQFKPYKEWLSDFGIIGLTLQGICAFDQKRTWILESNAIETKASHYFCTNAGEQIGYHGKNPANLSLSLSLYLSLSLSDFGFFYLTGNFNSEWHKFQNVNFSN